MWHNAGEGGMEVWLVLPNIDEDSACITGISFNLTESDVILSEHGSLRQPILARGIESTAMSAVVLLGSTGLSLHSPVRGYFRATEDDLMPEGHALFDAITKLFGRKPELLTALDT